MKATPKSCSCLNCKHYESKARRLRQHWAERRLRHYANTVLRRLAETATVDEMMILAAPRADR
jgi:NMD protein affecting ribosome stability and mRNA decay